MVPFALISLVSTLLGGAILATMIWKADVLARFGLTGNLYYFALLLFGLSVAGILFGVLGSYAKYKSKNFGGLLELGGPMVGFLITVTLGFYLVRNQATFALTVFVHGPGGRQDIVLRNSGEVVIDLGPDRVSKPIGDQGQAFFPAVPSSFRGQDLSISVLSAEYQAKPDQKVTLESTSLYVAVRRKDARVAGRLQDAQGRPIPGATIHVAGFTATAGPPDGRFEVFIPGDRLKGDLELSAFAPTYVPGRFHVVPGGNDLAFTLAKDR